MPRALRLAVLSCLLGLPAAALAAPPMVEWSGSSWGGTTSLTAKIKGVGTEKDELLMDLDFGPQPAPALADVGTPMRWRRFASPQSAKGQSSRAAASSARTCCTWNSIGSAPAGGARGRRRRGLHHLRLHARADRRLAHVAGQPRVASIDVEAALVEVERGLAVEVERLGAILFVSFRRALRRSRGLSAAPGWTC